MDGQVLSGLPLGHRDLCDMQREWRGGEEYPALQDGQLRLVLPQRLPKWPARLRPPEDAQVQNLETLIAIIDVPGPQGLIIRIIMY